MAKIGTAHLEVKPVVDDAALERIATRIEEAVAEGVRRGMESGFRVHITPTYSTGRPSVTPTSDSIVVARPSQTEAEIAKAARRHGSRDA